MNARLRRRTAFYGCALLLLVLESAALVVQRDWSRGPFVALALAQGAVYAVAACVVWTDRRRSIGVWSVLVVAALLRVGPLLGPVIWTSDIHRYVWDGRVQLAGVNPYCCVPADPQLAHLRDDTNYPQINRRDTAPTIYPPIAQMSFLAAAWLGGTVLAMKSLLVAFEAVGIVTMMALLRRTGHRAALVVLYAWHPLPIWEIAGSGHLEGLMVALVPLALLAIVSGRRALAGVALGAAVLTKFIPLALFPALWRRGDWRLAAAMGATALAAYLPYSSAGLKVFGYLGGYVDEEKLSASSGEGYWLVDALRSVFGLDLPAAAYLGVAALAFTALAFGASAGERAPRDVLRWAMALGVASILLLSPHYAWYFVLPVALATASPYPPALWPGLAAFVLYWDPVGGRIPVWTGALIYGGFAAAALAWRWWRPVHPTTGALHVRERAV